MLLQVIVCNQELKEINISYTLGFFLFIFIFIHVFYFTFKFTSITPPQQMTLFMMI